MAARANTVREFCWRILASGGLDAKLAGPSQRLSDAVPGPPVRIARPARAKHLGILDYAFGQTGNPTDGRCNFREGQDIVQLEEIGIIPGQFSNRFCVFGLIEV